jgi:primosomal protein N' (replication factor Y)
VAGLVPRGGVIVVDAAVTEIPDADVVVGTEAALHRVERGGRPVGLVAFLEFDNELLAPRYRAEEQALGLVVRGARLVGDRRGGGRVLIQTRAPDHEVLRAARGADPGVVLDAERARRATLGFPPFGGMAELTGDAAAVAEAAARLRSLADPPTVLGPSRRGALVRHRDPASLAAALATADLARAREMGRLRVAVDPPRV